MKNLFYLFVAVLLFSCSNNKKVKEDIKEVKEDIIEVKECCVDFLKKTKKIKDIKFLYGGSVNSKNFFEIRNECKIDGALIGGASLIEKEITNILKGDF